MLTTANISSIMLVMVNAIAKTICKIFAIVKGEKEVIAKKQEIRFPTLEAEMSRKKILRSDLAVLLGKTNSTITSRMDGSSEWIFWEMKKVRDYVAPHMTIDELFIEEVCE